MTWMKHAEHGGIADLPDTPFWRARGWEPTDDRPPEPDLYQDPPPAQPKPTEAPDDKKSPGLSAVRTKKPAAPPAPAEEAESDR